MRFLPRAEVLGLDELDRLCAAFIRKGVRKLRITGGEPLVRRASWAWSQALSRHLVVARSTSSTLTTNGTRLARIRRGLWRRSGFGGSTSRSTASTRQAYARITRGGQLGEVLAGIDAAQAAGHRGQDQHRRAGATTMAASSVRLAEWAHASRRGHHPHRSHADGRGRGRRESTSTCRSRLCAERSSSAGRLPRARSIPAARRAMSRPTKAARSASSRR